MFTAATEVYAVGAEGIGLRMVSEKLDDRWQHAATAFDVSPDGDAGGLLAVRSNRSVCA